MTRNATVIGVSLPASAECRARVSWDLDQPGTLLPTGPILGDKSVLGTLASSWLPRQ